MPVGVELRPLAELARVLQRHGVQVERLAELRRSLVVGRRDEVDPEELAAVACSAVSSSASTSVSTCIGSRRYPGGNKESYGPERRPDCAQPSAGAKWRGRLVVSDRTMLGLTVASALRHRAARCSSSSSSADSSRTATRRRGRTSCWSSLIAGVAGDVRHDVHQRRPGRGRRRAAGRPPAQRGLRRCGSPARRLGQIALWSLLAAGVGSLLSQIAERVPFGGRLATWVLGRRLGAADVLRDPGAGARGLHGHRLCEALAGS